MSNIPKHSCVVGLCVKNNAVGLPKVFENLSKFELLFDKFLILAYYDKSKDNSLELLILLSKKYNLHCKIINANCIIPDSKNRTVNIANARNYILKYIYNYGDDFDLFAMMDSNAYSCQGDIKLDVIEKYLKDEELYNGWDGLSFARNPYYDTWAYSDDVFQLGCWTYPKDVSSNEYTKILTYMDHINERIKNTLHNPSNKGKLIPVDSAFCGFAIYKKEVFRDCSYEGITTLNYMNKELLIKNLNTYKLDITNGIKIQQDCEHRQFHMMAKQKNGARIMVACDQAFEEYER
jgi:hypothetical protein